MPFRLNVAALIRYQGQYVACCRSDFTSWQCVQGGVEDSDASIAGALRRELQEELGLPPESYHILNQSKFWRRYYFTKEILAKNRFSDNIGQEQMWFFVELHDFKSINLEQSQGEFSKVELVSITTLLNSYAQWKKSAFFDFCRELGLLSDRTSAA